MEQHQHQHQHEDDAARLAHMAAGGDDTYPVTVHLGVLTATRPIGARVRVEMAHADYEGTVTGLTPSDRSGVYYTLHLRPGPRDEPFELDLPLSHPVTLLTGREGRPEDGHTFRFSVDIRGSSGIMAEGDEEPHSYADNTDFMGPVFTTQVRAWDLPTALRRAAALELRDWTVDGL